MGNNKKRGITRHQYRSIILVMLCGVGTLYAEEPVVGVTGAVKGTIIHTHAASATGGEVLKPGDIIFKSSVMTRDDAGAFFSMVSSEGKVKIVRQFSAGQFDRMAPIDETIIKNLVTSIAGASTRGSSRSVISPVFRWARGLGTIVQDDIDAGIMLLRFATSSPSSESSVYLPLTFLLSKPLSGAGWRLVRNTGTATGPVMECQGLFILQDDAWVLDFRSLGFLQPGEAYTIEIMPEISGRQTPKVLLPFNIGATDDVHTIQDEIARAEQAAPQGFSRFVAPAVWGEHGYDLRRLNLLQFMVQDQ